MFFRFCGKGFSFFLIIELLFFPKGSKNRREIYIDIMNTNKNIPYRYQYKQYLDLNNLNSYLYNSTGFTVFYLDFNLTYR